jgi:hypothetical protein
MSIIESKLLGCIPDDAGVEFLLCWSEVLKLWEENFRNSQKDNNSIFRAVIYVMASLCIRAEAVFREYTSSCQKNKVSIYKKVIYIYIFVKVIREILLLRKNKGLWTAQSPRDLTGLKSVVRTEYKRNILSSGVL